MDAAFTMNIIITISLQFYVDFKIIEIIQIHFRNYFINHFYMYCGRNYGYTKRDSYNPQIRPLHDKFRQTLEYSPVIRIKHSNRCRTISTHFVSRSRLRSRNQTLFGNTGKMYYRTIKLERI